MRNENELLDDEVNEYTYIKEKKDFESDSEKEDHDKEWQ